ASAVCKDYVRGTGAFKTLWKLALHPLRERFSDPDASWGHRSAVSTRAAESFYGFKIQAAVCIRTELPMVWRIETARAHESSFALPLLDAAIARGLKPETAVMDKGYDTNAIHDGCEARGCAPVIPLKGK